ncbi:MAG: hypothetical protein ACTSQF_11460 [Candidatus Heimdallarchaeaceae archaeon]
MSEQREIPESSKPAMYVGIMILSLVGAILNFAFEFAWWYESSSYGYNFGIGAEYTPGFDKFLIVLLGLMFVYILLVALQQLYPILKLPKEVDKRIEQSGMFVSLGAVILTIIITILFYVYIGTEMWDDGLGTGFYAGIIAGLLCALLFFLAGRIDKQKA